MDAKKLFADLVMVANIDGDVALQERILLDNYAKKLRLGFIEAQQIIDDVKSGRSQTFYKPKSQKAKNALYKAIVKIVRVDNKITSDERKLLRRLGNLLNIPRPTVEQAVAGKKPDFEAQIDVSADHTINVGGQTIDVAESMNYQQFQQTINVGINPTIDVGGGVNHTIDVGGGANMTIDVGGGANHTIDVGGGANRTIDMGGGVNRTIDMGEDDSVSL